MKKLLAATLLLCSSVCGLAQVVKMTSPPVGIVGGVTLYGRMMLAGDNQFLNTEVNGGTTKLGTWSCTNTSGTVCSTGTFTATHPDGTHDTTLTNAEPYITIQTDITHPGSCNPFPLPPQTAPNTMQITSTQSFVLTFTSNESGSHDSVPFYVCGNRPQTFVVPAYDQLFPGQQQDIQSWVVGHMDMDVTWSMTGTGCTGSTLLTTDVNGNPSQDALFTAGTTVGRCTVTATSVQDGTAKDVSVIYIAPNESNLEIKSSPTHPIPFPCAVDPELTGTIYEVGPGQTYATPDLVPLYALSGPGNMVRLHPGVVYHNYVEVDPLVTGTATAQQPTVVFCGIPSSDGSLVEMNGDMARGNSHVSHGLFSACSDLSLICVWHQSATDRYSDGPVTPSYIVIAGIHFDNTLPPTQLVEPDGVTINTWQILSSCVRINMGSYLSAFGLEMNGCGWGFFSDFNDQRNWGGFTGEVMIDGNYFHGNGVSGDSGMHNVYAQSWLQVVQRNNVAGLADGSAGAQLKLRGIGEVVRYNWLHCSDPDAKANDGCGTRQVDLVDIEDAPNYFNQGRYMGYNAVEGDGESSYDCSDFCQGIDTMGLDRITAWQALHFERIYGNVMISPDQAPGTGIHYNGDHAFFGIEERKDLYFYNNTYFSDVLGVAMFDTKQPGGNPLPIQEQYQRIWNFNNIEWFNRPNFPDGGSGYSTLNTLASFISTMGTNMFSSLAYPSPLISTPIVSASRVGGTTIITLPSGTRYPASNTATVTGVSDPSLDATSVLMLPAGTEMWFYPQTGADATGTGGTLSTPINFGASSSGWVGSEAGIPGYDFANATPTNYHITGLSNSSVMITPTLPFDLTTFSPIPSSPVIGAGTILTGPMGTSPVRLQMTNAGYTVARIDPLTIGATDNGLPLTTNSITITNPTGGDTFSFTLGFPGSTATCTATMSDDTTRLCTAPLWSSTQPAYATIDPSTGDITPVSAGSSTISVSANGLIATAAFSVIVPPPTELGRSEEIGQSVKIH